MPGGGTIMVSAKNVTLVKGVHPRLPKGDYVKISIKDTGTGILPDTMAHIFDPFFTTKPKGHGLGLAISYSIINRHKGTIDVESEPGKGSTFHIYLPASKKRVVTLEPIESAQYRGRGVFTGSCDAQSRRIWFYRLYSEAIPKPRTDRNGGAISS
jgi:two-component system cell cycle sensor histidine kinase/response regulator CckA